MITAIQSVPRIQKYDLLEEIGHGGMATVYRAHDQRLQRDVAVKLIHRHLRENEEVSQRFVSEAQAVAKLRHPNIVQVFDVSGEETDERYLIVELVRGASLRELLDRHHPMPAEVAVMAVLEVAAALAHAHENGVIHRDIKPENVLVELPRDEEPGMLPSIKLTDFGIAKMLDAQGITSTGQVLGSPAHMAPEQIEGGEVTVRADVFGLAVLLYECMVGQLPFVGSNPAQVLRRVLDGEHPTAVQQRASVGARWSDILEQALSVAPEERFSSIDEFAMALSNELNSFDLDEPMVVLGEYLADSTQYADSYAARVVPELLSRACRAREAGDVQIASAEYNRALAYKPGDSEILAAVGSLARRRQLRRAFRRVVVGALGVGVVGAVWMGLAQRAGSVPPPTLSEPAGPTEVAGDSPAVPTAIARPVASEQPRRPPPRKAVPRPIAPRGKASHALAGMRAVRVHIAGPGGRLLIDGKPRQWFARSHDLSVGSHEFEFLPPNTACCTGERKTVKIAAGQDELRVVGRISYRDATLAVPAGKGSVLCPTLFLGSMEAPGERLVPMSRPSISARCELQPAPGTEGIPAKALEVTLRPGQRTQLNWR
ncbi:MAG: protein kinase [Polyangiaceae bacterium]|nr:protein kinase [Polyangiaceae bacterium]